MKKAFILTGNARAKVCQDIDIDFIRYSLDDGVSLLINSNEQMFTEKLLSLLRFGAVSTRYKDIFDMFYLCGFADRKKLALCLKSYIFDDSEMRESDIAGGLGRLNRVFSDKRYLKRLDDSDKKRIDVSSQDAAYTITHFLESLA